MSVWTTKSLGRDRDYIVIKHTVPNVNNIIMGIRFRGGYAVVEANSKTYHQLKKIPILRDCQEYPLLFLQKLPFITRSADVRLIYGVDVFTQYTRKLIEANKVKEKEQKQQEETEHLTSGEFCTYRILEGPSKGKLCSFNRLKESPSGYCFRHLIQDPKLDVVIPMAMTNADRKKLTLKVLRNIEQHIKSE